MNRKKITILLLLLTGFVYSQNIRHYQKSYNNCDINKGDNCTYVTIDLAEVEHAAARDIINNAIKDSIISVLNFYEKANASTIEEGMNNFINAYEEESKIRENNIPWFLDVTGTLENQFGRNLICYSISFGTFTGGAHPFGYTSYFNLDPNSGSVLELSDLFKPGFEPKLNKLLDKTFRKQYNIKSNKSLTKAGFFVDKIEANKNFAVLSDGIMFFYNLYEIAPYVNGPTEITLSYKKLKDLIDENSIISEKNRK